MSSSASNTDTDKCIHLLLWFIREAFAADTKTQSHRTHLSDWKWKEPLNIPGVELLCLSGVSSPVVVVFFFSHCIACAHTWDSFYMVSSQTDRWRWRPQRHRAALRPQTHRHARTQNKARLGSDMLSSPRMPGTEGRPDLLSTALSSGSVSTHLVEEKKNEHTDKRVAARVKATPVWSRSVTNAPHDAHYLLCRHTHRLTFNW